MQETVSDLLGYQATSHESIRQEVLKIQLKEIEPEKFTPKNEKDILFLALLPTIAEAEAK